MFLAYLKSIGLENLSSEVEKISPEEIVTNAFTKKHKPFSGKELMKLYTYFIPKLSPDGSCSITDELQEYTYNLAETFGLPYDTETLQNHKHSFRLWHLQHIVKKLQKQTAVVWLGIYRKTKNQNDEEILLKEVYVGSPSRPEFPLTKEFAKKSNNATVGITGKAIIVQNVSSYKGPYYTCDGKVNSEFCVPILDTKGTVIGIIDAESFTENFFDSKKLLHIANVAFDLGQRNIGL